ncbi:MAG TPA: carboxypeptidase-like regulatory domain-containing protein [Candidatus Kryptonia bacterium]|nr:carboxypeptidase-like regulatory domain-containing protein [Candidatus Kryptonia bacterium]
MRSAAQGPSDARDGFVLSGTVLNSVTGEPISRALVRAGGQANRTAFSDSEGHFQFEGMSAGQVMLTAQKPGYFSEQDATGYSLHPIIVGPNTGALSLKLQPLSAISGRVTDAVGQPIERISVRLTCRTLRNGRKIWEPRGMTETDEDGHFRFPSLLPATYYVAVGPSQSEGKILASGEKPTTGLPHVYFPGVPDLASAAPIQLAAGQQYQADFSLAAVPVYSVTGSITGAPPEHGVGVMTLTPSGDDLMLPTKVNSELGTFGLDAVPAGTYTLKAMASVENQPLRAEQRITVAANLDNVHLALTPAISIPVIVHMQSRGASNGSTAIGGGISGGWHSHDDRPPISVGLVPNQPNASEVFSSFGQRPGNSGSNAMLLPNVDPGNYTVSLMPQSPWYVQSATYGQTNVLYDDIIVSAGQSYPLDIVLRDDSASLTISIRGLGKPDHPQAGIVILPQPASKLPPHVLNGVTNNYTEMGLAPGDYLVFAFDRIDSLEYTDPDALAAYASQAAHVTLAAGQQGQVALDLIPVSQEQ